MRTILPLYVLALVAPIASAQVQEVSFFPGLDVTGTAVPGDAASKAKIVRLTKTPAGANDGRLVIVYGDAANTIPIWNPKEGEHLPRDLFVRYSDDKGATWTSPVNISNTANSYSAQTDWDGDGLDQPYWGDSEKPNIFSNGDNIVVTWIDKYCPESTWAFGSSGQSAVQGEVSYADVDVYPNQRGVPFAGVYAAVSNDGGATWAYGDANPPIQLTYGRRDAKQDVNRGSGPRWIVTWQEDHEGLQPGDADGPGTGASGAKVSKGTDVWYTFTSDIAADPLALRANRTPLSNNSEYDMTGTDGFPTAGQAGSIENHGSSRANAFLLKDGATFKTLVAYEETKGIPDIVDGKTVQYHAFPFDAPVATGADSSRTGVAGTTLTDTLQNSRRVRFVAQGPNGVDPAIAIFWRQGSDTEGSPADIMLKASTSVDEAAVLAAPTVNLSTNTPNATMSDVTVDPQADPIEDARAHRAFLRGSFVALGYTYTWNGPLARYTDIANYDFWMRRSLDGGATWLDPQNVSGITDTKVNVKEPRLVGTPKTGTQDDSAFLVAWGTETNVYEGIEEPVPLDIQITRTLDQGATFAPVTDVVATLGAEFESQLRLREDGGEVYAVWMEKLGGVAKAYYATGGDPNPLGIDVVGSPAAPGDTIQLTFRAPGYAGELLSAAASLGFSPGIPTGWGQPIPLNPDGLYWSTFGATQTFVNFTSTVDSSDQVAASIVLPPNPSLSGLRFYVAFLTVPAWPTPLGFSDPTLIEIE